MCLRNDISVFNSELLICVCVLLLSLLYLTSRLFGPAQRVHFLHPQRPCRAVALHCGGGDGKRRVAEFLKSTIVSFYFSALRMYCSVVCKRHDVVSSVAIVDHQPKEQQKKTGAQEMIMETFSPHANARVIWGKNSQAATQFCLLSAHAAFRMLTFFRLFWTIAWSS